MFQNYFAAALRSLIRSRLYAGLKIFCLAIGFATTILITLFVRNEFSYDRWLPDYERMYLLAFDVTLPGRSTLFSDQTAAELAALLKLDFPQIEAIARFTDTQASIRQGEIESLEKIYWADPNFFDVIKPPTIAGDTGVALQQPDSITITRKMARKYFGRDDPIGGTLEIDRTNLVKVTAVIEDWPSNSNLGLEFIGSGRAAYSKLARLDSAPASDGDFSAEVYTYLRLTPQASFQDLNERLKFFLKSRKGPLLQKAPSARLELKPISALHLSNGNFRILKPRGDIGAIYAVGAVGFLILLVASINFVNLMTARASLRAVEVGVRKVSGAYRIDLMVQFLGESILYAVAGMILAILLVELLLPVYNGFLNSTVQFEFWNDPFLGGAVLVLPFLVGTLAGFYPAFVLSSFLPGPVLKGGIVNASGSLWVRQLLVVLQFSVLIGLAFTVIVVYRQTAFAMNERLRLDKDQVILIDTYCSNALKDEIGLLAGVQAVSCSGESFLGSGVSIEPAATADGQKVLIERDPVDFKFFELYGLKAVSGRFFGREHPQDAVPAGANRATIVSVVINEAAVRKLGFPSARAAIGKATTLEGVRPEILSAEIIGVVPDFALDSVRQAVGPVMYYVDTSRFGLLHARLTGRMLPETLSAIDRLWSKLGEARPIKRKFLDQVVEGMFRDIIRQAEIFSIFAFVALIVACIGLFALVAFTVERRTKEIGIRKALGASRGDIVRLLVWQFTKPVIFANLLALPLSWYAMDRWLNGFAYRIDLSVWFLIGAGAPALAIAVATVSIQAFLAARIEPGVSLKYE